MGFKVFSTDIWYVLPNSARLLPLAYFLFVFYLYVNPILFLEAFGIDIDPREHNLFWLLSLIYWTSFISSAASSLLMRSNAIKEECTPELVEQYLRVRPPAAPSASERYLKWEVLAQNVNEYIHSDLKTFNRSIMSRFKFTGAEAELHIDELVKDYGSKRTEIDDSDRGKLIKKLAEAHFKDTSHLQS